MPAAHTPLISQAHFKTRTVGYEGVPLSYNEMFFIYFNKRFELWFNKQLNAFKQKQTQLPVDLMCGKLGCYY